MNESLAARVGRLVAGGANALVDALEQGAPEVMMREAIREVEGAIDEVRAELGRNVADKYLTSRRLAAENGKLEELNRQAALAASAGRDDLAEAALGRILDIEAQIPVLESVIAERIGREKELEGFVRALQGRKQEMSAELDQFLRAREEGERAAQGVAAGSAMLAGGAGAAARVEKAAGVFERILGGHPEWNQARPGSSDAAKLAELEELARQRQIADRLAMLKSRCGE